LFEENPFNYIRTLLYPNLKKRILSKAPKTQFGD